MFQPIFDFFTNVYNNFLSILQAFWDWLLGLFTTSMDSVLQSIADALPDMSSYWSNVSILSDWVPIINNFFPLYEAGIVIGFFLAFIAVFITAKLVVKIFIPFVG